MPSKRYRWAVAALGSPFVICACSSGGAHPASSSKTTPPAVSTTGGSAGSTAGSTAATATTAASSTSVVPTTTAPPVTSPSSTAAVAPPPFSATDSLVTAADVPYTWRAGCPVPPSALRMITMSYWGFDDRPHTGRMVVNTSVVAGVESVFRTLYQDRFPIFEMVPEDAYQGNDNAAAAADDTSGFNCRDAVSSGPPQWSMHAYGEAIDVNDVQNPYVDGSTIIPPSGAAYLNRSDARPGMAVPGGALVEAFASIGWPWGGRWNPGTDYQHFSLTGG